MNERAIRTGGACGLAFGMKPALLAITVVFAISASLPLTPATADPIDACGLAPAPGVTVPLPEELVVTRVTGPNSFLTATGREFRLASVTTPHRPSLPPLHAVDVLNAGLDIEGGLETTAESDEPSTFDGVAQRDPVAAARSALSAWLLGQPVRVYPVTAQPDRYGRIRARVVRAGDGTWIEAELVKVGLARVAPQADDFGCARPLEAIENAARGDRRGLWALPEFAVLAADDVSRDRFIGSYVLIEGKVVSTGSSGTRRYLNFGRNFRRDFAVVLVDKGATGKPGLKPLDNRFRDEGFLARDIVGRRIRVRGVLLAQGGGIMMPGVPEEIEWVADRP